jgi:hypothetical protein
MQYSVSLALVYRCEAIGHSYKREDQGLVNMLAHEADDRTTQSRWVAGDSTHGQLTVRSWSALYDGVVGSEMTAVEGAVYAAADNSSFYCQKRRRKHVLHERVATLSNKES